MNIAALMPPLDGDGSSFAKSSLLEGRRVTADLSKVKPAKGQMKALVILMDFPDYRWDNQADTFFFNDSLWYTPAHFYDMLSSIGTYRHPGSASSYTGSLRDFYQENSYGSFDVTCDIIGYFTAKNNFAYYCEGYGANDWYLIQEALDSADKYVDFNDYDNDGDGTTDAIFFVHAGPGAEALPEPDRIHYIWSYMSWLGGSRDGVNLGAYSMQPEDGAIGVFCHEFGHQLGLPDWYDYDYSSNGIGEWGLMSGGAWNYGAPGDARGTCPSHISGVGKCVLGWITPVEPSANILSASIPPSENTPFAYLLHESTMPSNEYFIIENRQNMGFDKGLVRRQLDLSKDKGHGLIIWHVDENVSNNDNELHKQVDVEEASPYFTGSAYYEHLDHERLYPDYAKLYNGNRADNGDPWPGYTSYTSDTTDFLSRTADFFNHYSHPSSDRYSGSSTLIGVENISEIDTMIFADIFVGVNSSVESPKQGDEIAKGVSYGIEWLSSAAGGILYDSIYYSIHNGSWNALCRDTLSSYLFSWDVPDTVSDSCRIKIVSSNRTGTKRTSYSGYFTIADLSAIRQDSKADNSVSSAENLTMKSLYFGRASLMKDVRQNGFCLFDMNGRIINSPAGSGKYFYAEESGGRKIIKGGFLFFEE